MRGPLDVYPTASGFGWVSPHRAMGQHRTRVMLTLGARVRELAGSHTYNTMREQGVEEFRAEILVAHTDNAHSHGF